MAAPKPFQGMHAHSNLQGSYFVSSSDGEEDRNNGVDERK
ncbi:hypothetical protein F442_20449 [Phytophthora nicotianae P10297]|uniref:Uncharacterized protein n=3 Tax=Phytophthora nicotianae TaxID=4792 RepID=W2Y7C1_PHYNI|nr:hypothetical protein L917_17383 [Phytophthora nicotianae]ETO61334.1 hypothetical protein F444_20662 [Phytophthora nicotianae P1976]ETP30612.1 hypothetical protein F442_20449 [Phytophthora nicotianae P10297]